MLTLHSFADPNAAESSEMDHSDPKVTNFASMGFDEDEEEGDEEEDEEEEEDENEDEEGEERPNGKGSADVNDDGSERVRHVIVMAEDCADCPDQGSNNVTLRMIRMVSRVRKEFLDGDRKRSLEQIEELFEAGMDILDDLSPTSPSFFRMQYIKCFFDKATVTVDGGQPVTPPKQFR